MANIIIKDRKDRLGKSRSEIEKNLAKEGWGTSLTEEQIDKSAFLERKVEEKLGLKKTHINATIIDQVE